MVLNFMEGVCIAWIEMFLQSGNFSDMSHRNKCSYKLILLGIYVGCCTDDMNSCMD